jgi:hypothetical protein
MIAPGDIHKNGEQLRSSVDNLVARPRGGWSSMSLFRAASTVPTLIRTR